MQVYAKKKGISIVLVLTLIIGILSTNVVNGQEVKAAESKYGLNNPVTDSDSVTTWDCVYFGNYPQSDARGVTKERIKWRVLSVDRDDAFLLADKNLDVWKYNDTETSVTWAECTMRTWLNDTFMGNAFTASEQAAIKSVNVLNGANPLYGTEGGENTTDKVYLLSIEEVVNPLYGFTTTVPNVYDDTGTRQAVNTAYVAAGGAANSKYMDGAGVTDDWWLRSPGSLGTYAAHVRFEGCVDTDGYYVSSNNIAVRPALHLNLSSVSSWFPAGTVTSEGGGTEIAPPAQVAPVQTPGASGSDNVSPTPTPASPKTTAAPKSEASGTKTLGKVAGLKLKARKKSLWASWKKVSGASGYQVWCSTSKKFKKKNAKTTKKTKLTLKKLKAGKTYYVKVRAYTNNKNSGGKRYGKWSKVKKLKLRS